MSMHSYPANFSGLYVDNELLAYTLLALDSKENTLPENVKKAIADGTVAEKAKAGALYELEDLFVASDYIIDSSSGYMGGFTGQAETLLPERTKNPICVSFDDDFITYVPLSREPSLFEQAYSSPDECIEEFKSYFADEGIEIPDDFDWYSHFVSFVGTNFC